MGDSVGGHLSNWQRLNDRFSVFGVQKVEKSASHFESGHAGKEGWHLLFHELSKEFDLLDVLLSLALNVVQKRCLNVRVSLVTLVNKFLNHRLHLCEDCASNLRLCLHEHFERVSVSVAMLFWENFIKEQRVVSIKGEDHLASVFV